MTFPAASTAMRIVEKTILGFIAGAAAAIAIVETVLLIQRVIGLASSSPTLVQGMRVTDVDAPGILAASPQLASAQVESVALTIDDLAATPRGYLIVAAILGSLLTIGVCAVVAWLCLRVFVGRPFVRSATWGIGAVAILVILGGIGSSFFGAIAHAEIARDLGLTGAGLPALELVIDLSPFGWGLALAVVAGAFELGQRMQRDTEGLV